MICQVISFQRAYNTCVGRGSRMRDCNKMSFYIYIAVSSFTQKFWKLRTKQEFTDLPCNERNRLVSRVSPSNIEKRRRENAIFDTC